MTKITTYRLTRSPKAKDYRYYGQLFICADVVELYLPELLSDAFLILSLSPFKGARRATCSGYGVRTATHTVDSDQGYWIYSALHFKLRDLFAVDEIDDNRRRFYFQLVATNPTEED